MGAEHQTQPSGVLQGDPGRGPYRGRACRGAGVLHGAAAEKESVASEAKSKALGAAKAVLGPRVLVTDAQAGKNYRGKIVAMTDTHAIQRISENQAVLHEIGSMAREAALEVGSDVSVTHHKIGRSTVKTRSEERTEQERQNEREARR